MSWKLASTILQKRIPKAKSLGKLLLVVLADHCHGDSVSCWPSIHRLAEQCECSERAVYRELRTLKQLGYITRKRRQHRPAVFTLHPDKMSDLRPDTGVSSELSRRDACVSSETPTPDTGDNPDLTLVTLRPDTSVNCNKEEQALNRLKATEESKTDSSKELFPKNNALPEWLPPATWDAFLQMRRKIKAPTTPYAEVLIIRELNKLRGQGHDPTLVLEQSIKLDYKGVFPPKKLNGAYGNRAEQRRDDNLRAAEEARAAILAGG